MAHITVCNIPKFLLNSSFCSCPNAFCGLQSLRFRRGFLRKPLKVISTEERSENGREEVKPNATRASPAPDSPPSGKTRKNIFNSSVQTLPNVPPYEKLGEHDAKFTSLIALTKSKKMRDEQGKVLLEGRRLIKDALEVGVHLDSIYFSKEENLEGLSLHQIRNLKLYKVFYKQMSVWSDLTTSPGIMGVFHKPNYTKMKLLTGTFPVTVICDNIREPGNLGAILRSATAAGCKRILVSKGCTDVWDPKVLRGSAGSHFRIEIENNIPWETMSSYFPQDVQVYLASNTPSVKSSSFVPDCDSAPSSYQVSEDGAKIDPTYRDEGQLLRYKDVHLPLMNYYRISVTKDREIAVVVGGESEGLSAAAHKFAYDMNGCKITIPLANRVESLNVAVATGIILFHLKSNVLFNSVDTDRKFI